MSGEPETPPNEAAEREERVQEAAARIAEEDKPAAPAEDDEVDIAAEAARAGLEQAHRSAYTHP